MIKLDKTDYKILHELDYNARIPLNQLAKKLSISKQSLNYRIKKLESNNIIKGSMVVLNMHKLNHLVYRIYTRYKILNNQIKQKITNYLKTQKNILWAVDLIGEFDLEIVILAKNTIHFNTILKQINQDIGKFFSKTNISSSTFNYQFKRDYLISKERTSFTPLYYGFEPSNEKIDELDLKILQELTKNSRQNNQEIGKKIGVSYHTVKNRIKELENKGIIQGYRIFINLEKIQRKFYKLCLYLNNISKELEKKLYSFCTKPNFTVYLVEVIGEWQLEVETEIETQDEINNFLLEIRNEFPEIIKDYKILQVTKEHTINYLPEIKKKGYVIEDSKDGYKINKSHK